MTLDEQDAAEADVRMRVIRPTWMLGLLVGGVILLNAAVEVTQGQPRMSVTSSASVA